MTKPAIQDALATVRAGASTLRSRLAPAVGRVVPARTESSTLDSIRRHLLAAGVSLGVLFFGVGGWAVATEFAGAVITSGFLVVESDVKKVQHPTGGVVGELRVREGARVKAGEVLVRLDPTVTQANLAIVEKSLDEAMARRARLEAERDGAEAVSFPAELLSRGAEPEVAALVAGERKLFETRRTALQGQKSQLRERIGQLKEQTTGLQEQIAAKRREVDLINQELEGVRQLWQKKLVPVQRVTALERDLARIEGEKGTLVSSIAQAKGRMTETELQILQVDQDMRNEVGKELADIRGKVSELVERKVSAQDQLKRIDIRSPQDGIVHQMTVHTVGGVVSPTEPIMLVVPDSDKLTVEGRIAPQDISHLHVGQKAILKFPAFNQRTTPEIDGTVARISPDLVVDQRTGQGHYTIRIALPEAELGRLGGNRLQAGMPVEAHVQTQSRTVLSYLTKPFMDQVGRAFREN